MFKLTRETVAIVTVGLTLAGFVISSTNDICDEARAGRAAWQAEAQSLRAEARADREAFEKRITRLTREQSQLTGIDPCPTHGVHLTPFISPHQRRTTPHFPGLYRTSYTSSFGIQNA